MNNLDNIVGKPKEIIKTTECKYENYDIVHDQNNDLVILATESISDEYNIRDICKSSECKSSEALMDMLNMFSKLGIKRGNRRSILSQIKEEHYSTIIGYCKKHGLPFIGDGTSFPYNDYKYDNTVSKATLNRIKKQHGYKKYCRTQCSLSAFIYWLSLLYYDLIWLLAIYSPDKLEQYNRNLASKFLPLVPKISRRWTPSIVSRCGFSFDTRLEQSDSGFYFQVITDNTFHACIYFFSLLCIGANSNEKHIDKSMYIKQCKLCSTNFITEQSRRKYCPYCSPQKAWNKQNR